MSEALKKYEYYRDESAVIYCGDNRTILPLITVGTADCVVTDPPYNCGKDYGVFQDNLADADYEQWMSEIVRHSRRIAKKQAWVAPRYKLGLWITLLPQAHLVVVRRGAAGPYRAGWSDQFEVVLVEGKPLEVHTDLWDDIRLKGEGYFFREETYGHPGYTPSRIMARCVRLLSTDTVLDPFSGTGTSLVEAVKQGRRCIGIEINEAYCAIAAKRLKQQVFTFEPAITPAHDGGLFHENA